MFHQLSDPESTRERTSTLRLWALTNLETGQDAQLRLELNSPEGAPVWRCKSEAEAEAGDQAHGFESEELEHHHLHRYFWRRCSLTGQLKEIPAPEAGKAFTSTENYEKFKSYCKKKKLAKKDECK